MKAFDSKAHTFPIAYRCIDERARKHPEKIAIRETRCGATMEVSYDDLRHHTDIGASFFKKIGIQPGNKVVLIAVDDFRFYFVFFALNKIGAIPILQLPTASVNTITDATTIIIDADTYTEKELDIMQQSTHYSQHISLGQNQLANWKLYFEAIRRSRPYTCIPIALSTPLALVYSHGNLSTITPEEINRYAQERNEQINRLCHGIARLEHGETILLQIN